MSATEVQAAPPAIPSYTHRQILLIMSGLAMALLLASLDQTIVSTALTRISEDFHHLDLYSWVVTSYLLTSTASTPLYGKISDQFGRKRLFQIAIVIFLLGSAMSGLAQNMYQLIAFRGLQGVGAGGLMTLALAIIGDVIPPRERGRYQGYFGAVFTVSSVIGPLIGGFLVDQASWRWVFYVNLPIGAAAWLFGMLFLEPHRSEGAGRLDVTGFVLSAAGLGLVMYGVSEGPFNGWGRPVIVATIAAGAALLLAMVWAELRTARPLIDIRLFANGLFRNSNIVMVLGSIAFLGVLFIVALFFQDGLGLSALQSGLSTFPEALGVMAGAQMTTRLLYPTLGPRRVMFAGLLILTAALCLMTLIHTRSGLWWMRVLLFFVGYGMSHVFTSAQATGFATISGSDTARASTVFNAVRQLGGAIGVAALSTVVAEVGPLKQVGGHAVANLSSYHDAFFAAAGFALAAALAALRINDREAARTMVRRGRLARRGGQEQVPAVEPVPAAGA
jgi:EmrB/QacA subfamily drug resistance transporter